MFSTLAILPFTEEVKAALLQADAELQAAYNELDSKLSIQGVEHRWLYFCSEHVSHTDI